MKQKRTFTVEIDRIKITSTAHRKRLAWCAICRAESEFLDGTEAACLVKILKAQGLAVNDSDLHFYEKRGEEMLICMNSIIKGDNPGF